MTTPIGPTDTERRRFVLELLPENSVGVEIGVHLGDFAHSILEIVSPRKLHLVDPWRHEPGPAYEQAWYGGRTVDGQREMDERHDAVRRRFEAEILRGLVVVHRSPSEEALRELPDVVDWIYIDGNHRYEFVARDLQLGFEKVRPGGFVTGDDYREGGWWDGGVKRAVDEFAERHDVELLELRNGQYVFRKATSAS